MCRKAFLESSVLEVKGDLSAKECDVNCQFRFTDGQMSSLTILLPCVDVCHREMEPLHEHTDSSQSSSS